MRKWILFILILFSNLIFAADHFKLSSTSIVDKSILPEAYTCDGKDISPQFSWSGTPVNTKTLALILSDVDAPNGVFYHWVLFNIPKTRTALTEGIQQLPSGTLIGKNSWGYQGYKGPCPPKSETHRYVFTLYAIDTKLNLSAGADANEVLNAIKNHILDKVELTTTYKH